MDHGIRSGKIYMHRETGDRIHVFSVGSELAMDVLGNRKPEGEMGEEFDRHMERLKEEVEFMLNRIREFRDKAQHLKEFCLINFPVVEESSEDT